MMALVQQEGFEPPTSRFVAECSIQLSYYCILITSILYKIYNKNTIKTREILRKKEKCGNIKDIWGVNMRKEKINEIDKYIEYFKTIEKSEPFESEGFITVKNYEIKLNNGKTIHREQIYKSGREGNSVTILPVTKDNHVILVIEPRVFTKRTVGVEAPAGYVEDGEKASEAAERELLEETGFKAKELIQLREYYCDMGSFAGITSSFIAKDCEKISEQKLDSDEFIAIIECTIDEAKELINMQYIKDINTIYLIENLEKFI